eukprot:jgi/Ulvmu1/11643/UM008_0047.1
MMGTSTVNDALPDEDISLTEAAQAFRPSIANSRRLPNLDRTILPSLEYMSTRRQFVSKPLVPPPGPIAESKDCSGEDEPTDVSMSAPENNSEDPRTRASAESYVGIISSPEQLHADTELHKAASHTRELSHGTDSGNVHNGTDDGTAEVEAKARVGTGSVLAQVDAEAQIGATMPDALAQLPTTDTSKDDKADAFSTKKLSHNQAASDYTTEAVQHPEFLPEAPLALDATTMSTLARMPTPDMSTVALMGELDTQRFAERFGPVKGRVTESDLKAADAERWPDAAVSDTGPLAQGSLPADNTVPQHVAQRESKPAIHSSSGGGDGAQEPCGTEGAPGMLEPQLSQARSNDGDTNPSKGLKTSHSGSSDQAGAPSALHMSDPDAFDNVLNHASAGTNIRSRAAQSSGSLGKGTDHHIRHKIQPTSSKAHGVAPLGVHPRPSLEAQRSGDVQLRRDNSVRRATSSTQPDKAPASPSAYMDIPCHSADDPHPTNSVRRRQSTAPSEVTPAAEQAATASEADAQRPRGQPASTWEGHHAPATSHETPGDQSSEEAVTHHADASAAKSMQEPTVQAAVAGREAPGQLIPTRSGEARRPHQSGAQSPICGNSTEEPYDDMAAGAGGDGTSTVGEANSGSPRMADDFGPQDVPHHTHSYRRPPSGAPAEPPGSRRRAMLSPLDSPTSKARSPAAHSGADLDTLRTRVLPSSGALQARDDPDRAPQQQQAVAPDTDPWTHWNDDRLRQDAGLPRANTGTGVQFPDGAQSATTSCSTTHGLAVGAHASSPPAGQATGAKRSMDPASPMDATGVSRGGQFGSIQGDSHRHRHGGSEGDLAEVQAPGGNDGYPDPHGEWAAFTAGAETLDPRTMEFSGSPRAKPDADAYLETEQALTAAASEMASTSASTAPWQTWNEQASSAPPPRLCVDALSASALQNPRAAPQPEDSSVGRTSRQNRDHVAVEGPEEPTPAGARTAPARRGFGFAAAVAGPAAGQPHRHTAPAPEQGRRTGRSVQGFARTSASRQHGGGKSLSAMKLTQFPAASVGLVREGVEAPYEFAYIDYIFSNLDETSLPDNVLARPAPHGGLRPHSLIQQAEKRGTCSRSRALSGMRPLTGRALLNCDTDAQGNLLPVLDEAHTVVLHLKVAHLVPPTGLEAARSAGGQQRRLHGRRVRAVLVHMPDCRPGPGVQFLGAPEWLAVPTPRGTPVGSWEFQAGSCELLLRFPRCAASGTAWDRREYDEAHLRQLFLYVEFTVSYTALPEELESRRVLPDNTADMHAVLDEMCTAFALIPMLSLLKWQPGASRGAGGGGPAAPFPGNERADKVEAPLYIGDITKYNGILQLTSEVQLPPGSARRGRSRGRDATGSSQQPSPTRQSPSRQAIPTDVSPTGCSGSPVLAGTSGRGRGSRRRKRPMLVVSVPGAAATVQAAPLLPHLMKLLPATFLIHPQQALSAAAFRCLVARSMAAAATLHDRIVDPAVVYARRMLDDPELAPLLVPALTARLSQRTPTSDALAAAMRAVALDVGAATNMALVATRHIGNHPEHARQRRDYIRHLLLDPPSAGVRLGPRPPTIVRGLLLQTRQVEPMHAPLLIKDLSVSPSGSAAAFAFPSA